jgi:hypothetical protein
MLVFRRIRNPWVRKVFISEKLKDATILSLEIIEHCLKYFYVLNKMNLNLHLTLWTQITHLYCSM